MVKSACYSLVTKVGSEGEEGEGRELSQRRGETLFSEFRTIPKRDSGTASFRPHKQAWWPASRHRIRSAGPAGAITLNGRQIKVC
jgi:hypothetical protein